jgi:hypothetical protein
MVMSLKVNGRSKQPCNVSAALLPCFLHGKVHKYLTHGSARRRSSTAVLACSAAWNCPPRFPGTCATHSTVPQLYTTLLATFNVHGFD